MLPVRNSLLTLYEPVSAQLWLANILPSALHHRIRLYRAKHVTLGVIFRQSGLMHSRLCERNETWSFFLLFYPPPCPVSSWRDLLLSRWRKHRVCNRGKKLLIGSERDKTTFYQKQLPIAQNTGRSSRSFLECKRLHLWESNSLKDRRVCRIDRDARYDTFLGQLVDQLRVNRVH